jgi:hypothetical protein
MKRNILLGFLLIGLVVMEWGCVPSCNDDDEYDVKLNEITSSVGYRDSVEGGFVSAGLRDTILSKQFRISIGFKSELARLNRGSSMLYANDCGAGPVYRTYIDSVKIFEVIEEQLVDVSSSFGFENKNDEKVEWNETYLFISEINEAMEFGLNYGQFYLSLPVLKTASRQYNIKIFDTDGNIFETRTDPIIITP